MRTFYFPHSFIAPPMATAMAALFENPAIIPAPDLELPESMETLKSRGELDFVSPPSEPGDFDRIKSMLAQAKNWGQAHQGTDLEYLKARATASPRDDESMPFVLRDAIRAQMRETEKERLSPDLAARFYLAMAQENDASQWEAAQSMARVKEKESALFAALSGKTRTPGKKNTEGPARDHLRERLSCWSRLYSKVSGPDDLFVTPSQQIPDILRQAFPETTEELSLRDVVLPKTPDTEFFRWADRLREVLSGLLAGSETDTEKVRDVSGFSSAPALFHMNMDVFRVPEKSPHTVLSTFSESLPGQEESPGKDQNFTVCVLWLDSGFFLG